MNRLQIYYIRAIYMFQNSFPCVFLPCHPRFLLLTSFLSLLYSHFYTLILIHNLLSSIFNLQSLIQHLISNLHIQSQLQNAAVNATLLAKREEKVSSVGVS